jgi:hypothetical protein
VKTIPKAHQLPQACLFVVVCRHHVRSARYQRWRNFKARTTARLGSILMSLRSIVDGHAEGSWCESRQRKQRIRFGSSQQLHKTCLVVNMLVPRWISRVPVRHAHYAQNKCRNQRASIKSLRSLIHGHAVGMLRAAGVKADSASGTQQLPTACMFVNTCWCNKSSARYKCWCTCA